MKHRALPDPLALFARVPLVTVAVATGGSPAVRSCHAALLDGALVVHGGPRGDALPCGPATVTADEIVARVASWMVDPERACPATTFYRTARATGALEPHPDKAAALQALMEAHQPEGRHRPLSDPMYEAALRGTGVLRFRPERVEGWEKLGQDRPAEQIRGIARALWRRGGPGDLAAIEQIRRAHPSAPAFADAPEGLVPRCFPSEGDARAAAALAVGQYWNTDATEEVLARAVLGSTAWVGLEREGRLVASARAIADGARRAWIYDVVVAPELRRAGVGTALLALMLDHPAVRGAAVHLGTRDAQGFYARLGFRPVPEPPYPRTFMVRPVNER